MSQEALEGSIKKWKRIVEDTTAMDKAEENCPLCQEVGDGNCEACIVFERTGGESCEGTPYVLWVRHQADCHSIYSNKKRVPHCKECLRLARAELTFLESLRETKGE
jgi:hypothetical protein